MEFLEVPLFDDDLFKLMVRFGFNLIFVSMVVGLAYYPRQKKKPYVFTFLMMNIMVFFICFTLKKLSLDFGLALGLFAIFAIIRYRTNPIRVKEMTYLFVVVGLAVINALSNKKTSYAELMFTNFVIVGSTILFERVLQSSSGSTGNGGASDQTSSALSKQVMRYDNLELLRPEQREQLTADILQRTGISARKIVIKHIDLSEQTSEIVVHYSLAEQAN